MYTMRKGGKALHAGARYFRHTAGLPRNARNKKRPANRAFFSHEQMCQVPHSLPCEAWLPAALAAGSVMYSPSLVLPYHSSP